MTVRIYAPQGHEIRQSRNLRGLLDHARRNAPVAAALVPHPKPTPSGDYLLTVRFANGDYGQSRYASPQVCADFLAARRSWGRLPVTGVSEFTTRYNAKAWR